MRALLPIAVVLSVSTSALAHDPPEVEQLVSRTRDGAILATNRGLMFENPTEGSWSLLCSEGFGASTNQSFRAARLPTGRLLVTSGRGKRFAGLRISDDGGCTWQKAPALSDLEAPTLVQDPTEPGRVYAITQGKGTGGVQVSEDEAESFTMLLPAAEGEYLRSLVVVPSSPEHLYVTGTKPNPASSKDSAAPEALFFVAHSGDAGAKWERFPVELAEGETTLAVLAANPARPDELLASARSDVPGERERLLHSLDGGRTFETLASLKYVRSAAFSPDGKSLYVGSSEGLFRATDKARTLAPVDGTERISLVVASDDALLAAGGYSPDEPDDGIGIAEPGSVSFERWMRFRDVTRPFRCEAPSTVEDDCAQLWSDWEREFASPASSEASGDMGTPEGADAGSDGARGTKGPLKTSGGAGCAVRDVDRSLADGALALLLALTLLVRRRRQRTIVQ